MRISTNNIVLYCSMHVLLCCTAHQVTSRRSVPASNRLKMVSGSTAPHAMKERPRPCIRARAVATPVGRSAAATLHSVDRAGCPLSSLRRTSARLRLLERRTTARFLHVSPRQAGAPLHQPKHTGPTLPSSRLYLDSSRRAGRHITLSETTSQVRCDPHSDRRKEFYSRYIHRNDDDWSKVWHSTRFTGAYRSDRSGTGELEDVSRTFIRQRFSQRGLEDGGRNLPSAAREGEQVPWQSAVLRRSHDDGIGRFVIRRSQPQSTSANLESGRLSGSCRSSDIYGPRYSSPVTMQAAQSAAVPSSAASSDYQLVKAEHVFPAAEKPGSDEHVLYAALSQSPVGFHWLTDHLWHAQQYELLLVLHA